MSTRYTLSLPAELYEELKTQAEKKDTSIKDVVTRCLKIGLVAMKTDDDENIELLVRERMQDHGDVPSFKETRLMIM